MINKTTIKNIVYNKKTKQSVFLISTSIFNLIFSFYINMLLARILGAEGYGNFSYILNIFTFSQIFFVFGFFHSGSRMLAISEDKEIPKIYSAELVISVFLYLLMALSIVIFSTLSNTVVENGLLINIIVILPFGWVFLLINFFEILLPGSNDIKLLAKSRVYPRLLLVILVTFFYFTKNDNFLNILISYFASYAISFIIILRLLPMSYSNTKYYIKNIFKNNKIFGFKVYIGSVLSLGTSQLSGLFISHYASNNIEVGFYNIASQISIPLTLLPSIVGTVFFRDFAKKDTIPGKLFIIVLFICLFIYILIYLFSPPLISIFYGSEFLSSIGILNSLALGALFYGISDFFSKFLLAKGRGDDLLKISIIVGIVLIIANIFFIKRFFGVGAAYARILSGIVFFLFSAFFYLQLVNKIGYEKNK